MTRTQKKLLKDTLAAVEKAAEVQACPVAWAQDSWRCGSGRCFAGWAVTLAGFKYVISDSLLAKGTTAVETFLRKFHARDLYPDEQTIVKPGPSGRVTVKSVQDAEDSGYNVSDAAERALGLSRYEANELFAPYNDLENIREMVAVLLKGGDIAGMGQH